MLLFNKERIRKKNQRKLKQLKKVPQLNLIQNKKYKIKLMGKKPKRLNHKKLKKLNRKSQMRPSLKVKRRKRIEKEQNQ